MSDRGHVFIVDEDPRSAETLEKLLENNGYLVNSAAGGEDALTAIPGAEPNLVLLMSIFPISTRSPSRTSSSGAGRRCTSL